MYKYIFFKNTCMCMCVHYVLKMNMQICAALFPLTNKLKTTNIAAAIKLQLRNDHK